MSENRENETEDSEDFVESMLTSARSIIRTCLQIRSFETILIVTDPESSVIGRALPRMKLWRLSAASMETRTVPPQWVNTAFTLQVTEAACRI